ncbi:MAG: GAF domain-containing protein, partial [Terriglobales bacterium]
MNSSANSIDNRRGLRKSAIQEQICVVELAGDRSAMLLDVSELGIGVQSVEGSLPQSKTPVRFVLPGGSAMISGEGQVAWSDQTGCMGIRFTRLAPEMKEEIRKWINTESNPLFENPAEEESAVEFDARDRVAQLEARIMVSGWAQVQALNFLVDQVAAMTQASGVAIAVEDGNGIVCKASSGTAPQVGVRVNSRSGLSWECVRTGELVHCVDTETDPRVDRMVCRQLNMRAAMLVPVKRDGRITGLVEVFSSRAHAFNPNTVILLKSVADAVASLDDHLAPAVEPLVPPPLLEPAKPAPVPDAKASSLPSLVTPAAAAAAAMAKPATVPVPIPAPVPVPAPVAKPAVVADTKPPVARPAPLQFPNPVRETAPPEPAKPPVVAKPAVATPPPAPRPVPPVSVSMAAAATPTTAAAAAPALAPQKPVEKPREAAVEKAPALPAKKPREAVVPTPRETTKPAPVAGTPAPRPAPKPAPVEEKLPAPEMFRETESSAGSGLALKIGIGIAGAALCAGLTFGGLYWAHSGENAANTAQKTPASTTTT